MWVTGPPASPSPHQQKRNGPLPGRRHTHEPRTCGADGPGPGVTLTPSRLRSHRDPRAASGAADARLRRAESGWREMEVEPKRPVAEPRSARAATHLGLTCARARLGSVVLKIPENTSWSLKQHFSIIRLTPEKEENII